MYAKRNWLTPEELVESIRTRKMVHPGIFIGPPKDAYEMVQRQRQLEAMDEDIREAARAIADRIDDEIIREIKDGQQESQKTRPPT